MSSRLVGSNLSSKEPNIFADKSSLILEWLLIHGAGDLQVREVARTLNVSVGLVHKVFKVLTLYGGMKRSGLRTAKTFRLLNKQTILATWIQEYNMQKKCRLWTYNFGSLSREKMLTLLQEPKYQGRITLALHSAAEALGYKYSNLETLELYILDPTAKQDLEKDLKLHPQERSYQVLLIEPYYKSMLKRSQSACSPPLLTFLDLYHFPLRGIEQADYLASRYEPLQKIHNKEEEPLW